MHIGKLSSRVDDCLIKTTSFKSFLQWNWHYMDFCLKSIEMLRLRAVLKMFILVCALEIERTSHHTVFGFPLCILCQGISFEMFVWLKVRMPRKVNIAITQEKL